MNKRKHWAVFINNKSNKQGFITQLLHDVVPEGFESLEGLQGALFSKLELDRFIEEEEQHDNKVLTSDTPQSLKSMSSGERKKALLQYLLKTNPHFLILDNPLDNLDTDSQADLKHTLNKVSADTFIVQIISRSQDLLPFITTYCNLDLDSLTFFEDLLSGKKEGAYPFHNSIPSPLTPLEYEGKFLILLKDVSVSYDDKPILKNINWSIKPNEFWQLAGKNGSGKTTLLSMITGDNPKGYGQKLYLFGQKKGSGESVWDIKKRIGYFTPAMIDRFTGYHTLENMLISGLLDSIGLYVQPTEAQLRLAKEWLVLLKMWEQRDIYFHNLSMGQQRLIMCVRAMIKHPLLLILDEPTAGLDDKSVALFVSLVNKMAAESHTAIIFVSHRAEYGLAPEFTYELKLSMRGSIGRVL